MVKWLFGELQTPVRILETELSVEPIRADSVIFMQTPDQIFHFEFHLDVKDSDPPVEFRMLDYGVRLHRQYRLPVKQIVVLLKDTPANRTMPDVIRLTNTIHRFQVIRLWELDPESMMNNPALLPFVPLAKTHNPKELLNRVAEEIKKIDNRNDRGTISACTQILAGVRFEKELIRTVFKEDIMRESVIYQEILQEGIEKGEQKGLHKGEIAIISRLIQRKFGVIDETTNRQIQSLSVAQLEELGERLFDFQRVEDLMSWLEQNRNS